MRRRVLLSPEKCTWEIKHYLPGRVRIYGIALQGDHRLAHGIRTALHKMPGVNLVRSNCSSASVLVVYDETQQSPDIIMEHIRHAHRSHRMWDETFEAREVEFVQGLVELLARLDLNLRRGTGGRLTLRKLVLSLLTGKALYHVAGAGLVSMEGVENVVEVFLSWILFKHPRLEHEIEKLESYVHPGV